MNLRLSNTHCALRVEPFEYALTILKETCCKIYKISKICYTRLKKFVNPILRHHWYLLVVTDHHCYLFVAYRYWSLVVPVCDYCSMVTIGSCLS